MKKVFIAVVVAIALLPPVVKSIPTLLQVVVTTPNRELRQRIWADLVAL